MGFKRKIASVVLMAMGLTLTATSTALAGPAKITIDCDSVDVVLRGFANKPDNTANVNIDGTDHTVVWSGPRTEVSFGIAPDDGDTVTVYVSWNTNGEQGAASISKTMEDCQPDPEPSEEPSPEPTQEPDEDCEQEEGEEEGEDEEGEEEEEEECEEPTAEPTPTTPPTTPPTTQTTTPPATQPVAQTPVVTEPAPKPKPLPATDVKDKVKGVSVSRSASDAAQDQVLPATLAFTGPRDQLPVLWTLAALFFTAGLVLQLLGRRREKQYAS